MSAPSWSSSRYRRCSSAVVTDLGLLEPDPASFLLTLTAIHPGVGLEQVRDATGFDLEVSDDLQVTEPACPLKGSRR
jgi:acyl CoA:acetate/3-ketoacid CoA transferase beta subunit